LRPVVLDCSVTLAWCFEYETSSYSELSLDYVQKHTALVPPLWLSELTNVLLSAQRKSRIDRDGALLFLEKVSRLPIRIASLSSKEYFSDIFELAYKESLTSYDATYLYLAKREKSPLATLDEELRVAGRKAKLPKLALR